MQDKQEVRVLATTAGGKEVGVRLKPASTLYEIAFKTGGELPKELQGSYTLISAAEHVIKMWVEAHDRAQASRKTTKKA